ncbi:hypothetical protein ACLKMH_11560 [Psychromonas sp. KJ10-10]|uniref:hypothetical protein n=1 Tax=Psychromonas sp. KJ10-10 TaxID=3391823 RepID=UPI0039B4DA14
MKKGVVESQKQLQQQAYQQFSELNNRLTQHKQALLSVEKSINEKIPLSIESGTLTMIEHYLQHYNAEQNKLIPLTEQLKTINLHIQNNQVC